MDPTNQSNYEQSLQAWRQGLTAAIVSTAGYSLVVGISLYYTVATLSPGMSRWGDAVGTFCFVSVMALCSVLTLAGAPPEPHEFKAPTPPTHPDNQERTT